MTFNVMRPLILSTPPLAGSGSWTKAGRSDLYSEAEFRQREITLPQTVKSHPTEAADNSRHVSLRRKSLWVARTKPDVGRDNQSTVLWEFPVWS